MEQKQQRRKRNVRDRNAIPIKITERDIRIIETVYQCRILSQSQLHTLFFGKSPTASQRRLALLYDHAYLNRHFLTEQASYQFSPILYTVDKKGIELLQIERGYENIHWKKEKIFSQNFLKHTLLIGDVRVAVTLACYHAGYELLTWYGDRDLQSDYGWLTLTNAYKQRNDISLIPDSYFTVQTPHGKAAFFLEADRETMTTTIFKHKIETYIQYYQSGAYTQRYGMKSLRVLTVTLSQERAKNLQRVTEQVGGNSWFLFTVRSQIRPETVLQAPIWSVAGESRLERLIELG